MRTGLVSGACIDTMMGRMMKETVAMQAAKMVPKKSKEPSTGFTAKQQNRMAARKRTGASRKEGDGFIKDRAWKVRIQEVFNDPQCKYNIKQLTDMDRNVFTELELKLLGTGRAQAVKADEKRKYIADTGAIDEEKNAPPYDILLDIWNNLATCALLGPIPHDLDDLKIQRARLKVSQSIIGSRQRNTRKNHYHAPAGPSQHDLAKYKHTVDTREIQRESIRARILCVTCATNSQVHWDILQVYAPEENVRTDFEVIAKDVICGLYLHPPSGVVFAWNRNTTDGMVPRRLIKIDDKPYSETALIMHIGQNRQTKFTFATDTSELPQSDLVKRAMRDAETFRAFLADAAPDPPLGATMRVARGSLWSASRLKDLHKMGVVYMRSMHEIQMHIQLVAANALNDPIIYPDDQLQSDMMADHKYGTYRRYGLDRGIPYTIRTLNRYQ